MQYQVRALLAIPTSEIWNIPDGFHDVFLDDGDQVPMHRTQIVISRYAWIPFERWPLAPITLDCCFVGENFGPMTHLEIINQALWRCFDYYKEEQGVELDNVEMAKLASDVTSDTYNDFIVKLDEYPCSSCVLDFLEIADHPDIKASVTAIQNSDYVINTQIEESYVLITKRVKDPIIFPVNQIAMAIRSNNTKLDALLQTVGVRGNATDIDSRLFRKTIKTGYLYGIRSLVDQMMDSRTSAKALSYSRKPMQDSEYLNRRLQLTNGALFNLHRGDCGTTGTHPILLSTKAHLRDFNGKLYMDSQTQQWKPIRPNDDQLVGKVLNVRTLFNCKHPDRYGVCSACFGELAYSIMPGTNIGHQGTINMQSPIGQLLLSAKHFTSNAGASNFQLGPKDQEFIVPAARIPNTFLIANRLSGTNFKIQVLEKEAVGLNNLPLIENVSDLSPVRATELTLIAFYVYDDAGNQIDLYEISLSTDSDSRKSSFSSEMLHYIKEVGWTITENSTYEIDMSGWNTNKPFLFMPLKQFSTPDYMMSIERMVRGESTREVPALVEYDSIPAALMAFHDRVSERMAVNIACLEAIILSTMVEDLDGRDFLLPIDKSKGRIAKAKDLIFLRSLAPFMAYETQSNAFFGEESYIITRRPSSPLDDIIMPQ